MPPTLEQIKKRKLGIAYHPKASLHRGDLKLGLYAESKWLKFVQELRVGKRPFAKIHLPCSCKPAPYLVSKDILGELHKRSPPWGLSIDAMRTATRAYHEQLFPYTMQSFEHSCIGAVWTVMKAGLADVISDFKPPKATVMQHVIRSDKLMQKGKGRAFLMPSDVISAGNKLAARIRQLELQQLFLDVRAYSVREPLAAMVDKYKLRSLMWHKVFTVGLRGSSKSLWRTMSATKSLRCQTKKDIDKLMVAYDSNDQQLRAKYKSPGASPQLDSDHPWRFEAETLLRLEARWEALNIRTIKAAEKALPKRTADLTDEIDDLQMQLGCLENNLKQGDQSVKPEMARLKKKLAQALEDQKRISKQAETLKGNRAKGQLVNPQALKAFLDERLRHEEMRRSRAEILIKLHQRIFDYVFGYKSADNVARTDQRFLAVLLLGQLVSWRFSELTHDNLSIELRDCGERDGGFVIKGHTLALGEKDVRLGQIYAHYRI